MKGTPEKENETSPLSCSSLNKLQFNRFDHLKKCKQEPLHHQFEYLSSRLVWKTADALGVQGVHTGATMGPLEKCLKIRFSRAGWSRMESVCAGDDFYQRRTHTGIPVWDCPSNSCVPQQAVHKKQSENARRFICGRSTRGGAPRINKASFLIRETSSFRFFLFRKKPCGSSEREGSDRVRSRPQRSTRVRASTPTTRSHRPGKFHAHIL